MEMRILILFSFLLFGGFHALHADESFRLDQPPPAWAGLLETFAENRPVHSRFTEVRSNPFHRVPRRFSGEIAWHPEIGLSLRYTAPSDLTVNILPQGVFIGRAGAKPRSLPQGEQQEVMLLFSKLFSWDTAWLAENFASEGKPPGPEGWTLVLRPREETFSRSLTLIRLSGAGEQVESIFIDLKGGKTVEVSLEDPQRPDTLTEEQTARAFPFANDD